ncbi:golgin subfamily A member 2 isoform X2 [Cherax quadricarinatus]
MADSERKHKLAAARKKLRQFQKKKGTKHMIEGGSKDGTSEVEGSLTEESSLQSESGTLSSRASSVDLVSEEFTEIMEDDSLVSSHDLQSYPQTLISEENGSCMTQIHPPGGYDPGTHITEGETETGVSSPPSAIEDTVQVTQNRIKYTEVVSTMEVENARYDVAANRTVSADDEQAQEEENTPLNNIDYSFQPLVVESEVTNHDSCSVASDNTDSPDLLQNELFTLKQEAVTNAAFIQIPEPNEQNTYVNNRKAARQQVSFSNPIIPELPKDEPDTEALPSDLDSVSEQTNAPDVFEREGSVSSETTASVTTAIHVSTGETQGEPLLKSSSESLRQISLQLSGLMSESEGSAPGLPDLTISELERRNAELAALLQKECENSQQQTQHTIQLKAQLERLEAELAAAHAVLNSAAGGGAREVESLREQLQVHIQTIGILVSEKSELQSNLTHANYALKQKAGEVIELDGRLSASRQRVGELEASLKDLTSQCTAAKSLQDTLSKELDATKMTNFKTNKVCEELKASVAELTERLSVKTGDYDTLCSQLTDTKSQLAMAQLHVQQLRDGTSEEIQCQLEQVQAAHLESQRQLQATQTALSQAHADNAKVALHYQQYTTQLASQTQSLQEQIKHLIVEKEELSAALEDTKDKLEAASTPSPSPDFNRDEMVAEKEHLKQTVTTLQDEILQLKEQNAAMTNDNRQLSKLVDQLSCNVEELEMKIERSHTEEVDTSQLLAAMQSDKVAAARALTQNKQLKEQLEELQSGFIIMSNKKLELTEKLEKELHVRKALNQEIATLNEDITNMKQQLVEKDRDITVLRENGESLGAHLMSINQSQHQTDVNQMMQAMEQLSKENTTYEEHVSKLEEKLRLSQVETEELSRQNSKLHNLITEYSSQTTRNENLQSTTVNTSDEMNSENNEGSSNLLSEIASLTALVSKLELERNNLQSQLNSERTKCAKLSQDAAQELPQTVITSQPTATQPSKELSVESFLSLQEAHKALEDRFSRSMKQVAELSDDKQRLEHVIQQLQVETETIGDYITIYQFQRGVMKQQARERELELSSLLHEREEMRIKLATLQDLVSTLALEKGPDHEKVIKMTNVIKSRSSVPHGVEKGVPTLVNGTAAEETTVDVTESTTHAVNGEDQSLGEDTRSPTSDSGIPARPDVYHLGEGYSKKSPTVQRILDLLNEMEATSQVEHCGLQKFHPCPLCSGKLITV